MRKFLSMRGARVLARMDWLGKERENDFENEIDTSLLPFPLPRFEGRNRMTN